MKHYSNSPKDSFFNSDEKSKKLPLPSLEAYNILRGTNALDSISSIVYNFNQMVDQNKSVLKSHHYGQGRQNLIDNQAYINDMNDILARLNAAVKDEKPYRSLFGDVVRLKEHLQVIIGYYQDQLKKGLPDVKAYQASASFAPLMSAIAHNEKPFIDGTESQEIEKFVINHNARDIMNRDMLRITDMVMNPFLEDHSRDTAFSYC
ncbi:hypothetical protein [Legionella sainthelensi]|uniref:Uncharacterized protein n=1 Tax=Legionella sainthelensi TaxID=28087 RepID=A0A2H5FHP0_9GAMM|nr:hypothetical protein [Legionella sainthelensi]AUH71070.1 hypothetical protein CAB17_02595 [Legionella sainthelensi]